MAEIGLNPFDNEAEPQIEECEDSNVEPRNSEPVHNVPDFILAGHNSHLTNQQWSFDDETKQKGMNKFRQWAECFVQSFVLYLRGMPNFVEIIWKDMPFSQSMAFFVSKVSQSYLIDFLCTSFLWKAQVILTSAWQPFDLLQLPRVTSAMKSWGVYVDILWHHWEGWATYVGSATGQRGL